MTTLQADLRVITSERIAQYAHARDDGSKLHSLMQAIEAEIQAAYSDAREHTISAFLSILAGGCSDHVVVSNYSTLRDYLGEKAGISKGSEAA
jgi:hypothetical protein